MIVDRQDTAEKSVLIVDRCQENREVLRTVLQRRGMRILEACGARHGLQLARQHRPGVVVLDLDCDAEEDESVQAQFDAELEKNNSSLVVLATARHAGAARPRRCVVSKPYHYAPLIRTIEQLLRQ